MNKQLTHAQMIERDNLRSYVIRNNGNTAFQMFTKIRLEKEISIISISTPINAIPTSVEFVNKDLCGVIPANDCDNPDGIIKAVVPIEPVKPKRPSLKIIK